MKSFDRYHSYFLLFYFLVILAISMFIRNPVIQIIGLVTAVTNLIVYCPEKLSRSLIRNFLIFGILIALINPLISHDGNTPLFYFNSIPYTLEALLYGVSQAVMIISVILWCIFMNSSMNSERLSRSFGSIIPKTSLAISMTLRMIETMTKRYRQISTAQKASGVRSGTGYMENIRGSAKIITSLIGWSLDSGVRTDLSMRSRGFGWKKKRTISDREKWHICDSVVSLFVFLLSAVCFAGSIRLSSFVFYPSIQKIDLDLLSLSTYTCFFVLSLLPSVLKGGEDIRWKYYLSKI